MRASVKSLKATAVLTAVSFAGNLVLVRGSHVKMGVYGFKTDISFTTRSKPGQIEMK